MVLVREVDVQLPPPTRTPVAYNPSNWRRFWSKFEPSRSLRDEVNIRRSYARSLPPRSVSMLKNLTLGLFTGALPLSILRSGEFEFLNRMPLEEARRQGKLSFLRHKICSDKFPFEAVIFPDNGSGQPVLGDGAVLNMHNDSLYLDVERGLVLDGNWQLDKLTIPSPESVKVVEKFLDQTAQHYKDRHKMDLLKDLRG